MQFIDLSHTVFDGLITYKGLPAPIICDYLSREDSISRYEPGTSFQIGRIDMVANTGTYMDCPFHRYAHGRDLAAVHIHEVASLPGIVIRVEGITEVGASFFYKKQIKGHAILVHTG